MLQYTFTEFNDVKQQNNRGTAISHLLEKLKDSISIQHRRPCQVVSVFSRFGSALKHPLEVYSKTGKGIDKNSAKAFVFRNLEKD